MERFVARPSPLRLTLLLLLSVGFVALGFWMIGAFGEPPRSSRAWAGWIAIPVFGLFGALIAARLFDRRAQIVVDAEGLMFRQWSDEHIPWSAVSGIDERTMQGQRFFGIYLHDISAHPPTRLVGKLGRMNSALGFAQLSISATGTDRSADELRDALMQFFHSARD